MERDFRGEMVNVTMLDAVNALDDHASPVLISQKRVPLLTLQRGGI